MTRYFVRTADLEHSTPRIYVTRPVEGQVRLRMVMGAPAAQEMGASRDTSPWSILTRSDLRNLTSSPSFSEFSEEAISHAAFVARAWSCGDRATRLNFLSSVSEAGFTALERLPLTPLPVKANQRIGAPKHKLP